MTQLARETKRQDGPRRRPAATARVGVLAAPGRAEIVEQMVEAPGPRQVRVRLQGCGVCGSNVPVWQGRDWFSYPLAAGLPGHEGWGVIDAVGEEVDELAVGQRVATLSEGAFAEYLLADAADVNAVPRGLEGAALGEPLGCAMMIFGKAGVKAGDEVAVVGAGFMGLLVTQLAVKCGARVLAMSRRETSLAAAQRIGAQATVALQDGTEAMGRAWEISGGGGFDIVVEATGMQAGLNAAARLVRESGRLVIAGFHQDGLRQIDMCAWNWKGLQIVNAHERSRAAMRRHVAAGLAAQASGELDPAALYTHRFPLEQLGHALDAATERPEGFIKALVMTEDGEN